ncbi:MAG TPA: TatD family hydrolase [Anaerolineales bacterium]|nr:TatD family hydrolase [Anaerolineales bacterium]
MLTDTHCHLDFSKFDDDRDAVIQRAHEAGVERIVIPALDYESSLAALRLAASHPSLFAAVGYHPTDLDQWNETSIENLRNLILESSGKPLELQEQVSPSRASRDHGDAPAIKNQVIAIGEIGLDYYWVKEPEKRTFQQEVLRQQLQLAQDVNKPVIIHMREENDSWFGQASVDLLEMLATWHSALHASNHPLAEKPGVLHSFNGNLETAQKAIAMNFYIGVTGPVTYKNAAEKRAIIRQLPITKLLIETDAPFLTPAPHRGQRNEPAFVAYIADKIAEIHDTTREHVARVTSLNAIRLFGWEAEF